MPAFHVLVVTTPATVAAFHDVDHALALAGSVRVIVHAEDVAVLVECYLLEVAKTVREDLEAAPVRLAAQDAALVRLSHVSAVFGVNVHALVADGPVDPAIRADDEPVHVMPRIGDVMTEAMGHNLAFISHAIAIRVPQTPEVRRDGHIDPAVMPEDAGGNACDLGVEAFRKDRALVGNAIAIGVFQPPDPFGVDGQILPVDGAVFVVIGEFTLRAAHLAGGEDIVIEGLFLIDVLHRDIVRNPQRMLANVQISDFATRGLGCINHAVRIDGHGHRVRHVQVTGPLLHLQAGCWRGRLFFVGCDNRNSKNEGDKKDQGAGSKMHECWMGAVGKAVSNALIGPIWQAGLSPIRAAKDAKKRQSEQ